MSDLEAHGSVHRGDTDWGGLALLVALLLAGTGLLVFRSIQIARNVPSGGLVLVLLCVGLLAFVWMLFAFYWARGQFRTRAVRRLLPTAVLFEVVMTYDLAAQVRAAEDASQGRLAKIWPQTYITVAATSDRLWFFGGSFVLVRRASIAADRIRSVAIKTVPFETRTVTRHFPAMVMSTTLGSLELDVLPMRTTLMVPRKLSAQQLAAASHAVAAKLGVPLV